jgi:hypothetical protein
LIIDLASTKIGVGTSVSVGAVRAESGGGVEMAGFDEVREQYHRSVEAIIKGDPEPQKPLRPIVTGVRAGLVAATNSCPHAGSWSIHTPRAAPRLHREAATRPTPIRTIR